MLKKKIIHIKSFFLFLLVFCFSPSVIIAEFASWPDKGDSLYIQMDSIESCRIDSFLMELRIDSILAFAKTLLGVPYHYSGTTPAGFDCSGFTAYVFSHFGIQVPHGSSDLITYGIPVEKESLKPGDLVLFKSRNAASNRIRHVGIITENSVNGIFFIHASVYNGITIYPLDHPYYINRYIAGRRLIY